MLQCLRCLRSALQVDADATESRGNCTLCSALLYAVVTLACGAYSAVEARHLFHITPDIISSHPIIISLLLSGAVRYEAAVARKKEIIAAVNSLGLPGSPLDDLLHRVSGQGKKRWREGVKELG